MGIGACLRECPQGVEGIPVSSSKFLFNSYVSLKKKNKLKITLISGPHVHKKSRDQYKIDYFSGFFILNISSESDFGKFLEFKAELYQLNIDEGFNILHPYEKRDVLIFTPPAPVR